MLGPERAQYPHNEMAYIEAMNSIATEALTSVEKRFGSGYPSFAAEVCSLSYHNVHHSRVVAAVARQLTRAIGLDRIDQALAETAGSAHDYVQLKGRGTDEAESADWLDAQFDQSRSLFSPEQRTVSRLAILGTQPIFDTEFNLVGQIATTQDYPSKRAEQIAKSVASADLGDIFKPEGPLMAQLLYQEMHREMPASTLSITAMLPFQRQQMTLLSSYRHPLENQAAQTQLTSHKAAVIQHATRLVTMMEAGIIESQAELMQINQAFIREQG